MRVVAFNGSPCPGGNSEALLEGALSPLRDAGHSIRVYNLYDLNIKPCQDCGGCAKTGVCVHEDAMVDISIKIREAERIILASPIFFFNLSTQAKIMIDRCQAFWCEKYVLKRDIPAGPRGRKGLLLLVGGRTEQASAKCAEETGKAFFRTVSVPEHETLTFGGIDAKGDILKHPTALKLAAEAGKRLGL
ncbi:MAG TPA: flavodoxin family protein [Nitrospirota bacterium]|nr:flavodoxin family protein [Nitrospirota bacterium]